MTILKTIKSVTIYIRYSVKVTRLHVLIHYLAHSLNKSCYPECERPTSLRHPARGDNLKNYPAPAYSKVGQPWYIDYHFVKFYLHTLFRYLKWKTKTLMTWLRWLAMYLSDALYSYTDVRLIILRPLTELAYACVYFASLLFLGCGIEGAL